MFRTPELLRPDRSKLVRSEVWVERPTLQDVQSRLWEALNIVDPAASEALELCTREWEKHLYDGSDNHWPAGEALLNTLRVNFANR